MPSPRHSETRLVKLSEAWDLLQGTDWEIAERRAGAQLVLGRPPIRPRPGGWASATVLRGPDAQEGVFGVRTLLPTRPAGATWVATDQDAREEYEKALAGYARQTAGEERVFRVELVIEGEVVDLRLVAVGEITPSPDVLDALSLTYIGVVLSVALALALGIGGLTTPLRIALFVSAFLLIALLLQVGPLRRAVIRFARWALRGSHDADHSSEARG